MDFKSRAQMLEKLQQIRWRLEVEKSSLAHKNIFLLALKNMEKSFCQNHESWSKN